MVRRNTYATSERIGHTLTLAEVKMHLRADETSVEDTYIDTLITAAENQAETILRRTLLTQTLVLKLDCFPSTREIELDLGPVQSVTSCTYKDGDDATQTLSSSLYSLDNKSVPDVLRLEPDEYWPDTKSDRRGAVTITYVAGWASAAVIPGEIKLAIQQMIGHWYSNRESVMGAQAHTVPQACEWLLWPHRDLRF